MWSLANEPIASNRNLRLAGKATADSISLNFFRQLFKTIKEEDNSRLACIVGVQGGPMNGPAYPM